MESSVKQRLILFLEYKNITKNKFEKLCGLSTGYIKNMRVSIQPNKIKNIAAIFPDLNTGWLLTGMGEMVLKKSDGIVSEPTTAYGKKCERCRELEGRIQSLEQTIEAQRQTIQAQQELIAELKKSEAYSKVVRFGIIRHNL